MLLLLQWVGSIHCSQLYIRKEVLIFLTQSIGCCMKRGTCGVYTIHPPCCLHGSALNAFPLFLTCHHKKVYQESCNYYEHSSFEIKGNQVSNVRESWETHCRILPKLLKFLIKAQSEGKN